MSGEGEKMGGPQGPRAQLARLERAVRSELKSLGEGAEPLLEQVRAGVAALFPEPGATRLAPQEQQARRGELLRSLDELEDVLEALQMAARAKG
jgi:hypothetical protein